MLSYVTGLLTFIYKMLKVYILIVFDTNNVGDLKDKGVIIL